MNLSRERRGIGATAHGRYSSWYEGDGLREEQSLDLWLLKPGHKIRTSDGSEAEVLSATEDGEWIKVKYLEGDDSLFGGTEDLVSGVEVEALLGVARTSGWGEKVTGDRG